MVKKFATGIQEFWLYIPTTSAELSISWLSFLWFLIPPILSLFWFYEALYYLKIWEVVAGSEWSYYVISTAISMKLGILQIDLDLAIFQKTAVGILKLSDFFIMLRTIRVFFIFGILAHLLHSHDISNIIQTWEPYL